MYREIGLDPSLHTFPSVSLDLASNPKQKVLPVKITQKMIFLDPSKNGTANRVR